MLIADRPRPFRRVPDEYSCDSIIPMDWLQDLRFAIRMFRKSPGPMAVLILAATLGIGANTAIFSVIQAVILRPLPYQQPDRSSQFRNRTPLRRSFLSAHR